MHGRAGGGADWERKLDLWMSRDEDILERARTIEKDLEKIKNAKIILEKIQKLRKG